MIATEIPAARMQHALDQVRHRTGAALAFSGLVLDGGDVNLRLFSGVTLGALAGVTLKFDAGLGGRSVALRRPIAVNDYFESDRISHQYDRIIQAERLRSLIAAPIVVERQAVGVLYAANRNDAMISGRIATALMEETRALEQEVVTMRALRNREASQSESEIARLREQAHSAYAELRLLGATMESGEVQAAIRRIADTLRDVSDAGENLATPLSQRETDVLALVASGLTNQEIGSRLGLTLFTVKSYMKSIMSKLGAKTRLEAVVIARRAGALR